MTEIILDPKFEQDLDAFARTLRALPDVFKDVLQGDMCYEAARVITKAARGSNAFQDQSGKLRKSFRAVRIDVEDSRGREIKDGGARAVMGRRKTAPHGHLIELGTENRVQTTTGRRTGKVVPRLVLTTAFENNAQEAFNAGAKIARRNFKKMAKAGRKEGKLSKRHQRLLAA